MDYYQSNENNSRPVYHLLHKGWIPFRVFGKRDPETLEKAREDLEKLRREDLETECRNVYNSISN